MDIKLVDAVAAMRDELLQAASHGVGQDIAFSVGQVEMEFEVELRREVEGKAKFKAWVVAGEVGGRASHNRTHRVKVTLTPQRPDGTDWLVHGNRSNTDGPGDVSERIAD